jgi:hypothetical protein
MRGTPVTRFGITGHQNIPPDARPTIEARIRDTLARHGGERLVGIGSLAAGADQLFARCVLDLGGTLVVVIPCDGYETTFGSAVERGAYHAALAAATSVQRLSYPAPSEEAFMAAGTVVADGCDLLIAVWDGQPAVGLGGTGDVVRYARGIGRDVVVVWPDGVRRT